MTPLKKILDAGTFSLSPQSQFQLQHISLPQVNPRKLAVSPHFNPDEATIDPKNFATIRTTSIVQRQQKEHLQEEMHEQMSGYKRLRRDHQAALAKLEEACRHEMEKHKQLLDKEYEQLLTQFSKELEKLQLKHQEELGKRLKMNINTEKKLIKEVSQGHETERKSFESKMKAEYKIKKERWKKEMESQETPKSQRNQGNDVISLSLLFFLSLSFVGVSE